MLVEELLTDVWIDIGESGGLWDKVGHWMCFSFLKVI